MENLWYKGGEGSEYISVRSGDKVRKRAKRSRIMTDALREMSASDKTTRRSTIMTDALRSLTEEKTGGRGPAMISRISHEAKAVIKDRPQDCYDTFRDKFQIAFSETDEGRIFRHWVRALQFYRGNYYEVERRLGVLAEKTDQIWRRYSGLSFSRRVFGNEQLSIKLRQRCQREWDAMFNAVFPEV